MNTYLLTLAASCVVGAAIIAAPLFTDCSPCGELLTVGNPQADVATAAPWPPKSPKAVPTAPASTPADLKP